MVSLSSSLENNMKAFLVTYNAEPSGDATQVVILSPTEEKARRVFNSEYDSSCTIESVEQLELFSVDDYDF
jgi:hypothetical protein